MVFTPVSVSPLELNFGLQVAALLESSLDQGQSFARSVAGDLCGPCRRERHVAVELNMKRRAKIERLALGPCVNKIPASRQE
jgi:hypothetical protein